MIQPEAYYAAHKKCHSPEELGRLGFIIVGRGDELSPAPSSIELSFAETLMECNQWHNEKREEVKEKWRKDKARQRKDKEMSTNVHQCPQDNDGHAMSTTSIYLPTYLPTYLPNKQEGGEEARSRLDVPDKRTVVSVASSAMGITEEYASWWYDEMTSRDWQKSNGDRVNLRNWRSILKSWWNKSTPEERSVSTEKDEISADEFCSKLIKERKDVD